MWTALLGAFNFLTGNLQMFLLGIGLCLAFGSGYWVKSNVFPTKAPVQWTMVKYKMKDGTVMQMKVLRYKQETYYPSLDLNLMLKGKYGLDKPKLKNLA